MGIYVCKDGTEVELVPTDETYMTMTLSKGTTEEDRVKFIESYNENELKYNPSHACLLPLDWCKEVIGK